MPANADIFQARKCVHVKIETGVHKEFRQLLIQYGVSMQEAINEFAKMCAINDKKATVLLDAIVKRKIDAAIANMREKTRTPSENVGELDHETLYDLIDIHNDKQDSHDEKNS